MTVPQGTVQDVLDWVGDDPARAQEALDAEYEGANRSTLISQLEAIVDHEEGVPMSETAETTELAPPPEPPEDVQIYVEDEGTYVGVVHVRDADVDLDTLPEPLSVVPPEEGDPTPIDAEQVLALQGVVATNGAVIVLNGTAYAFTPSLIATLKGVVERAIASVTL